MVSEFGEYRNYSLSNAWIIVIQQYNEPWNGHSNFLVELDFNHALAMSG
jgi:hypothetical protein